MVGVHNLTISRWVLAAVNEQSHVIILDPVKVRSGRQRVLGEEAVIENLLLWLEQ